MDRAQKQRIVEALVLGSPEPISAQRLAELIPYCKPALARELVEDLNREYIAQKQAEDLKRQARDSFDGRVLTILQGQAARYDIRYGSDDKKK